MKQFRSQTPLMPDKNGPIVHQQKKSVTKVTVEAVGSVDSSSLMSILFFAGVKPPGPLQTPSLSPPPHPVPPPLPTCLSLESVIFLRYLRFYFFCIPTAPGVALEAEHFISSPIDKLPDSTNKYILFTQWFTSARYCKISHE